jgi:hypothetical protein
MSKRPSTKEKLEALKVGTELPVDPRVLSYVSEPGVDERACLILARCYKDQHQPPAVAVSWADQVKACEFFNLHGLAATLDECLRLDPESLT